jgi:RNA polymerase sigma-70 factor (ECF subfamily)
MNSVSEREWLAERFEEQRGHLRAVAYRMLGSFSDADDAVQEAWLRLSRSDAAAIENLGGWLTTVVARISLNMLKARKSRREEPVGVHVPDPVVSPEDGLDPEQEALLADSVGLAPIVGRSPTAARQLASRARRRVQSAAPVPDADLATQREVVEAFLAAAREGDFDALVAVLDPDVVLRADAGALPAGGEVRGAEAVARGTLAFSRLNLGVRPALINGAVGLVSTRGGKPFSVVGFTVRGGKITELDILADPERLRQLDLSILDR